MEAQGAEAEERAFSNPHFYHVIPSQRLRVGHRYHPLEGVQNELPQNVSLWHVDYFELKVIDRHSGAQGKLQPLP